MQWKQKSGDACRKRVSKKESGPFVEQFSSEQPEQDYNPGSNRDDVAYCMTKSEDTQNHCLLLDPDAVSSSRSGDAECPQKTPFRRSGRATRLIMHQPVPLFTRERAPAPIQESLSK